MVCLVFFSKIALLNFVLCVHEYKAVNIRVPQHACGGRRTMRRVSSLGLVADAIPARARPLTFNSQLSQRSGFIGMSTATQSLASKVKLNPPALHALEVSLPQP